MEHQILLINMPSLRKRIKREINLLTNQNICVEDNVVIKSITSYNTKNITDYMIEFKNLNDQKYYKFMVPLHYPFKPPKLFINNKSINLYYKIDNIEFNNALIKYNKLQCFCCNSLLCPEIWSPQFTFINILNDVNKVKTICREIAFRVIINVIKRKYLIEDINLVEWLY